MTETILNIFLVIEKDEVIELRGIHYEIDGDDEDKIKFLKAEAKNDFGRAEVFDAPQDKSGKFMKYSKFAKLEKQGMQFQLFEEIFQKFGVPQNPLICVTPVLNGEILAQ